MPTDGDRDDADRPAENRTDGDPTADAPVSTEGLSWDRGPASSRFVRVVVYFVMGVLGGVILGFVGLFGPGLVSRFSGGLAPWVLLATVVLAAYFGPMLLAGVLTSRVRRERYRLAREWYDATRSAPSLVAALLVGGLLVFAGYRFDWSWRTYLGISFAGLLFAQALTVVAGFLGSAGEIDADDPTLTYAGRDDVDLRRLRDVKRFSIGRYTVLWLILSKSDAAGKSATGIRGIATGEGEKGAKTGGPGQDLYAIPTEVVERAWPVFERGISAASECGVGDEAGVPTGSGRVLWKVNVFVGLAFVAGSVGLLAFFVWLGVPAWQLLQWLWIVSGISFFFLRLLVRTY